MTIEQEHPELFDHSFYLDIPDVTLDPSKEEAAVLSYGRAMMKIHAWYLEASVNEKNDSVVQDHINYFSDEWDGM